jgi:uncharacterized membrane protein
MADDKHHLRFHVEHQLLSAAFGADWFGVKAEGFARFFGTPKFLFAQTLMVAAWVVVNATGPSPRVHSFDGVAP